MLRRVAAAVCAAAAVSLVVAELRPPPPATVPVVAAASTVEAGALLGASDLTITEVPEGLAEPGALVTVDDAVGRRIAAALDVGETLTRTRLVPRSPAEGLGPGRVALHVGLADPAAADVVRVGQDVVVFPAMGGSPLATSAVVLSIDPPGREVVPGLGEPGARGAVLALAAEEAERVLSGHGGLEGPVVVNIVATASNLGCSTGVAGSSRPTLCPSGR